MGSPYRRELALPVAMADDNAQLVRDLYARFLEQGTPDPDDYTDDFVWDMSTSPAGRRTSSTRAMRGCRRPYATGSEAGRTGASRSAT
jgi:ketosteroid isomerase-like protein